MKDFAFDLQRFANPWTLKKADGTEVSTHSTLSEALAAAEDGYIIALSQNVTDAGISITKSVTIDLGDNTLTISGEKAAFTTNSSKTVTFQNGKISKGSTQYSLQSDKEEILHASGNVILKNLTTNTNRYVSSSGSVTIQGDCTLALRPYPSTSSSSKCNYTLENGTTIALSGSNSLTLTTKSDKTATVVPASGKTFTATPSGGSAIVFTSGSNAATFTFDESGNPSVTNLSNGVSFTVTKDSKVVTYTVNSYGLRAAYDGKTSYWEDTINSSNEYSLDELDFDKFTAAILTNSKSTGLLEISTDSLNVGDEVKVLKYDSYTTNYGYLKRDSTYVYTLTKDGCTGTLSGITVKDGLTVQIASDFINVPITVSSASTSLRSTSKEDFTLSSVSLVSGSSVQAASVMGAVNISLGSGTVKISESDDKPTISAGGYSVSYASGEGDGVAVVLNSKSTQVSGIDTGESFNVNEDNYYRDDVGLRMGTAGVFTSDIASITSNGLAVELSKLNNIGTFIETDSENVLEIGKNNKGNSVVVDDASNPTIKHAELLVGSDSSLNTLYTLRTADGDAAEFIKAVDTISLTGGKSITVDKDLVISDSKNVTIAAGVNSSPDATFKVTAVTGTTFTVNLKTDSAATTISSDATAITLLSGTINALAGQTITLGEGGRSLAISQSSNGMEVTVTTTTDSDDNPVITATIKGEQGDIFTIDNKSYEITNSDGMTFTVTKNDVVVSDLSTADNDSFIYDGTNYSVRGAGFVMTKSGAHSLWTDDSNNHSIPSGSLDMGSLSAYTWNPLATVDAKNNAATLPPSSNDETVTLIGNDFAQTYGIFTSSGTACTLTTGSASNETKLDKISVSSAVDDFYFGANLASISIFSGVANFIVTADDSIGGYQVTVTSSEGGNNPAIFSGAKSASLINGTAQVDDSITIEILDTSLTAAEGDKITVSTNGTATTTSITAMEIGERFSILGGGSYVMSKVGLVNDSSRYLLGTREGNPIILSELTGDTPWGGLIDKNAVTLTADSETALIVGYDDDGVPTNLYADYISGSHSLRASNSVDAWDSNIVINVDDTSINFSKYFSGANIKGVKSNAEFTVTDATKDFAVNDTVTGAVVSGSSLISQTGGTISLIGGQTIQSAAGTVYAATGNDIIFSVDDDAATIDSFDVKDSFTFEKDDKITYTRNTLGVVTDNDKIFTAYTINGSVTVADLLSGTEVDGGKWTNTVYIDGKTFSIPPDTTGTSPWVILNNNTDKNIRYGTLAEASSGGYTITKSSADSVWPSDTTFRINDNSVTFSTDFSGRIIYGLQSKASVKVANATGDFKFTDAINGAVISGDGSAVVNQLAGTVTPRVGQTITAGTSGNYSIAATSSDDAINVYVSGNNATINALSADDEFIINDHSYKVLNGGVIRRDGTEIWKDGTVGTSATAASLDSDSNWYGLLPIKMDDLELVLDSDLVSTLNSQSYFLVDEDNHDQIYGKLTKDSSSYALSTDGANVSTFKSVSISTAIENITLTKTHFIEDSVSLKAGNATFIVTDEDISTFGVNYSYKASLASVKDTGSLTLLDGTLALSDTNQTLTANGQKIAAGTGTITANVTTGDDDSKVVTVGSLDAGDSVVLNNETYTYSSGNGMTITIADGVTKFTNLDDNDQFIIGDYTFVKTAKGLTKKKADETLASMYMGSISDVDANGIDVKILNSTDSAYWKSIAQVTDENIEINGDNTTAVLVGSLSDPTSKIYGTLTVEGNNVSLTRDDNANATAKLITVVGVQNMTVNIEADTVDDTGTVTKKGFSSIPIVPTANTDGVNAAITTDGMLTFQPAVGQTFTVNDTSYTMTADGLVSNNSLWEGTAGTLYELPNNDAPWSALDGTFPINEGDDPVKISKGLTISVEKGSITATAEEGSWTNLSALDVGDIFTIGTNKYKVLADGKSVGLYNGSGTITKIYATGITDGTIAYNNIINSDNYSDVLTLTTDGVLDLTTTPLWTGDVAVLGIDSDGDPDPNKSIATVNYTSSSGYTLQNTGSGDLNSISLKDVKTFTTAIYKPINTSANGTYTINNKSFAAESELEITPSTDGVTLTSGTVSLTSSEVLTPGGTVTATTGTITVNVDGSTVKIGNLTVGKVFSVDSTTYTMAALGVQKSETTLLYVEDDNTITVEKLKGEWETILPATNGALTVDSTTPDSAVVVDTANAVKYGTLIKSATDSVYDYTKTDSNLTSITVNGVAVRIPATTIPITANGATFTASGDLTVDASTTIPSITATDITLTAGTINAPINIPVTVSGKKIIATNNSAITVGLDGTSIKIGALDVGDTFSIDGTEYTMTGAGLYIAASDKVITNGFSDDRKTYTVGDYDTDNVVVLDGGVLDLKAKPTGDYSAIVVYKADTDTEVDVTKKVAKVEYSATDDCYTLSEQGNYFGELDSVSISAVNVFNTELSTTVTTPASGTYIINGVSFTAADELKIKTAKDSAMLNGGTVSLVAGAEVLTSKGTITADSNNTAAITVNVDDTTVKIGGLDNGKAFDFGGKTYTKTSIGLSDTTLLLTLDDTSVTTDKLGTGTTMLAATDGNLTIDDLTGSDWIVVDSTSAPATNYGTLNKSGSDYTFTQNTALKSITAGDATFKIDGYFTVNLTSTPKISGATAVTLTSGTIAAPNIPVTVNGRVITTETDTGEQMTISFVDGKTTVGGLNLRDTFKIGETTYKLTNAGLHDEANNLVITEGLSDDKTTFTIGDSITYTNVVALESGVLDLTEKPAVGYSALVVKDSNLNPSDKVAIVTYDGTGYTLSDKGDCFTELISVKLSSVTTFNTSNLDDTVTITTPEDGTGTYKINGKSFTAAGEKLTIDTNSDGSTLTNGTVSLAKGAEVLTPKGTITAASGNSAAITVNVSSSVVKIGGLDNGKAFDFGGKTYTKTSIGLTEDGTKLIDDASSTITTDELSGGVTIIPAADGKLTVDEDTVAGAVVDLTNPNNATNYGTLTKDSSGYSFEQNTALTSITLDGVRATFPATNATFKANDATFTAGGNLTVDASSDIPSLSGASSVTLTAGTINAPSNIAVTVGTKKITATKGNMTIGLSGGKAVVGNLIAGDTFDVDGKTYKISSEGELFSDNQIVTNFSDGTFVVDDATYTDIITPSGTTLNLNKSISDDTYFVYASDTNPTKRLAELEVKGSAVNLNATDDNTITTVNIANGTALTVDFAATVNGTGSATVNGEQYNGTGDLTIYATEDSSALFKGNINLTSSSTAPKLTNDDSTLTINNGTVTAQIANGKYDKLSNLAQDDSFDYNGTTYTQTKLGMVSGGTIAEKLAGSTVSISDLASAEWSTFLYPVNGTLDLQGINNDSVVYDDPDNPSKKLATLNLSNGKLILNGASGAAKDITTILIDNGANLTVDFTAQISATSATVNGSTYNGTGTLTIDAKSKASTLYAGTVTLNSANPTVKPSAGSAVSTTGTINATAALGKFVQVSDLGTGENFTFGGNTYTQSRFGLVTGGTIAQDLTSSTVDLDTLSSAKWETFIASKSGTLDLSKVKAGCVVFNDITNPSTKLADLTVDGSNFTLAGTNDATAIKTVNVAKNTNLTVTGFDTKVNAPIGTVTINGQNYDAASETVIDTVGETSTLTKGKVNISPAASVTTTAARTVANSGDKSITLDANGSTLTVGNLAKNSVFGVDDKEYMITSAALFRTANSDKATAANSTIYTGSADVFGGSITVAQLDADTWGNLLEVPDSGALAVNRNSDSALLVSSDLEKLYGSLTKSASGYTLTKANANANFTAINADGVALNMASDFAKIPISAGDNDFSGLSLSNTNNFTLDATDTVPGFSGNVTALKLDNGSVAATANQSVSAGGNVISGDVIITNGDNVTVSEIGAGETFTLNGKEYKSATVGLINLDDSTLVTNGFADSALNVDAMRETKFIGAVDGVLDLTAVKAGAPVFDSISNPTKQIGTLTIDDGKLTLNGTTDIKTVKVAADSNISLDFAAQVEAPKGSVTVNGKSYLGTTALTLQSDGTTSTLASGTVSLGIGENVTVGENLITATAGDGLTVTAGDNITINGLNSDDKFTVDGTAYTICAAGLISGNELFTGGDYSRGVTLENLANNDNWTQMQTASYGAFAVDASTLEDGGAVVLVDSISNPTKTYGTLTKTGGEYLLMKDDKADAKLSAITVAGTIIDIDTELADVPITTVNADDSESIFTVKPTSGAITFRVDATGKSPKIDGVDEIDIIKGKVEPQDGQIIKPADGDGEKDITISYGNGEHKIGGKTVIIDGLDDGDTVDFELDKDGNIKKITGLPKGATITIDGTTYTSPFDDATLIYTDEDGWYFDGWTLDAYTVTIDADGNIKVDTGIRFRNVISSGRTLGADGTIQLSGERGDSSVKIINGSGIALKVNDSDASTLAENLGAADGVTFSKDGVAADDLQAVADATINLGEGQSLTAGDDTTITATNGDGLTVTPQLLTPNSSLLTINGSAQIEAPADTELNLGAGDYSVNGVEFTSGEKTQATATDSGIEFNLADSTGLTYDGMNLTGDGAAAVNSDGTVTLTDGAIANNTTGKTLTIAGEVQLDDKTVNVDSATAVTATDKGLNVGETELEVIGDDDGYIINIEQGTITGLENIGNPDGVTIGGLDDASIKSDKAGSLTVGGKTFRTSDNSVTWIDDGQIKEVGDVEGTVAGDFSDGLTVNGENIQVQSNKNSEVEVVADEDGVKEIQATEADKYTINGKQYETDGEIKFNMSGGSVTGIETDDATFAIGQNETDFTVNNETLNLTKNSKPVTLDVVNGAVSGVYGVDGAISGLSDATVYDLTRATVNGIPLDISGSIFDASIEGGTLSSIVGIDAGSTINSAPDLRIVTSGNGSFTFGGNTYHVSDSLDSSVTFMTDENSNLTAINDFAGEVSGAVTSLNLNGKDFGTNNPAVTVSSNGENITQIAGVKNGDSIGGDIDSASFTMPEGKISINGGEFILEDNGGDAAASNGGKIITGIAKDASLTVGADGSYQVNGRSAAASAGGVFTVNRDGSYLINPNFLPIIEKTPAGEILGRSGGGLDLVTTSGTVGAGKDSVAVRNNAEVVIQGEPLIVATSGSVTLENYTGAASIGTFEYLYLGNAIKSNSIQFGDGVMTLGDAVITFEENASSNGATRAQLLNAQGREQLIGFTHTAGGTIDAANETKNLVLKGNYAENSGDTQKSGGSNLIGGSGDDMLLIGGGDTANGGDGNNQIYLTNSNLRELGAVIIFSGGTNTVHNFNGGYGSASDMIIIGDLNAIEFSAGASDLVMRSGNTTLTFSNMRKRAEVTLSESSDAASTNDGSYRLMLNDGAKTYNAAIAQSGKNIVVTNGDLANVFYGNGSGVNFSEYTGAVAVNLGDGAGNVGGASAQFNGIDKLTGGAGNSSLTGAADMANTLTAGTGDGIIWSNSGNDLMIGNTSATKTGFTTFNFFANDGQDTITGFDFANDWIDITTANEVTSVSVRGSDVIMFINESETDYLTLAQGVGKNFRINNLNAQVAERNLEFDGLANCFVATGTNATMEVGADVTQASIWLCDEKTSMHGGSYYLGDITVLDGSKSAGNLILVGNDLNNTIIGGAGENSIYGGLGDDMLIGGDGKNTFFFAMVSGNDVITGAHDGDVIDLGALAAADISSTVIDGSGTAIALTDGSLLEVRSNAVVEYKTTDGTYTADHTTGQWLKKQ